MKSTNHHHLSWRVTWRVLFWLCAGSILFLALSSSPPQALSTGWDKLNHVCAFLTLTALGLLAYSHKRLYLLCGLIFFGALIEGLQSLSATREAQWQDFMADLIGISLAWGLVRLKWPTKMRI